MFTTGVNAKRVDRKDTHNMRQITDTRHFIVAVLAASLLALSFSPLAAAQDGSDPAHGGTDSTGRQLTDFAAELSVPGFDSSLGELAAVDLIVSGSYDGQVLQILNQSGGIADFLVETNVRLCADAMPTGGALTYAGCAASATAGSASVVFDTGVVQESFVQMPAGAVSASAVPGAAVDAQGTVVLDPAALADFVDVNAITFGVATLAGFEALGGGGNSTVQVETFADVTLTVAYQYISLDVVKLTNGVDRAVVVPGDAVEWTYDVTNTGNAAIENVAVVDDLEGDICVIAAIAPGATERCALTGVAGDSPYTNIATATGTAAINPAVTVSADDPSSYVQPAPTVEPTAEPTPEPTVVEPAAEVPLVDIELSTNTIDADTPDAGPELADGDLVTWRYVVTNTGTTDLVDLIVTDDHVGGICTAVQLAVGESFGCTREGVAGVDSNARISTVVGKSRAGETVTDRDPTHHRLADEVEESVVTPSVVPVVDEPDEVLALTGESGNLPAAVALVVAGLGLVVLSASEALRRRHEYLDG